jgi:hypothetical protein
MFRFKLVCGAALLLTLFFVGVGFFTGSTGAQSTPKSPAPTPVHSTFQVSRSYVSGNPAIQTHAPATSSGPAFTQNDVVAFFNKYGFFAGPVVAGSHLRVLTIQFVTARQASQLMQGESVGRPDDALVCYVKVEGPFLLTNLHGGPANVKTPTTARYGDAVFDAHTGNILVWGVYY